MIYYHLAGFLGYVLIIGSVACFLGYVALLVLITGFFGNEQAYQTILVCFFVGIMLFQLRSLLVDFISEHVFKSGKQVPGQILQAENCGQQGGDNDQWYQLMVQLDQSDGIPAVHAVYIEQLFKECAKKWLKPGARVAVRYAPKMRLAIVDHADAYQRLHAGPQFSWRRR